MIRLNALKVYCSKEVAQPVLPAYPLDVFTRMRATTKDDLRNMGFDDALAVPAEYLNQTQQRIQRVSHSGVAELTREALETLAELPYPRYYLDFETINLAVPRWALTSPYSTQVPFQWSCHIEPHTGYLRHTMFLDVSGNDPRRECAETMIAALGNTGPVFVYFQAFEKGRIAELAVLFLELAPALLAINERIVDLLPLTRISYYHPAMLGSWSIKAVLPTIAPELDYAQLAVGNGTAAQDAYREILHPSTPYDTKEKLTQGLRDYCTLDTMAMVRVAWFLGGFPIRAFLGGLSQNVDPLADRLLADAEAALREYCRQANTNLIVGPVSLLQRRLKANYSPTLLIVQQLEDRGLLSAKFNAPSTTVSAV